MESTFKALQISDSVYWVGAIDWSLRDFHGYATSRGTTYNAFLIMADKITLIDTVKRPFLDEMVARIRSVVDPERISYLVSNHAEMDHSGCLPELLHLTRAEKLFASKKGCDALHAHFHLDAPMETIREEEKVDLGNMSLSFQETPMLHWPESMFTFLDEEGVLFSQDAFGMHLATSERFADEVEKGILEYEASKYFANILLLYASQVKKQLEKTAERVSGIRLIAPDHGPLWRGDVRGILDYYYRWADQKPTKKALIVYDTMWESTAAMAQAIGDGIRQNGVLAKQMPLKASHRSDVATEMLNSGAVLVGSPTLNNNMFPTVADVLTYLKGLRPKNKIGAAFGSCGWGGEAVKQIQTTLSEMKFDMVGDGLKVKYVPDGEALKLCFALGTQVAEKLKSICD